MYRFVLSDSSSTKSLQKLINVKLRLLVVHANSYKAKYLNAIMTFKSSMHVVSLSWLLMMNRNPRSPEMKQTNKQKADHDLLIGYWSVLPWWQKSVTIFRKDARSLSSSSYNRITKFFFILLLLSWEHTQGFYGIYLFVFGFVVVFLLVCLSFLSSFWYPLECCRL